MGADLVHHSAAARQLFELADQVTGLPITRLCAEGPLEHLTATEIAQPAVVTTSLAALTVLREHLPNHPDVGTAATAGHSVGELSAYVAAGVLDARAALRLVHVRATAMAEACAAVDGSMLAVIGLDEDALRVACLQASREGSSVEVANLNAPGQLVVAGAQDALARLGELAQNAGARRIMPLKVGGPFHSTYMRPAAAALSQALDQTTFQSASLDVVLNTTAQATRKPDTLRQELATQVSSPVRWIESLHELRRLGCDRFLEVGPGAVLSGLVKRTLGGVPVANFGSLADLPSLTELMAA